MLRPVWPTPSDLYAAGVPTAVVTEALTAGKYSVTSDTKLNATGDFTAKVQALDASANVSYSSDGTTAFVAAPKSVIAAVVVATKLQSSDSPIVVDLNAPSPQYKRYQIQLLPAEITLASDKTLDKAAYKACVLVRVLNLDLQGYTRTDKYYCPDISHILKPANITGYAPDQSKFLWKGFQQYFVYTPANQTRILNLDLSGLSFSYNQDPDGSLHLVGYSGPALAFENVYEVTAISADP